MQFKFKKIKIHESIFIVLLSSAAFLFLPKLVLAASIYLTPTSGNYSVGSTIRITVKVNTNTTAVNTAESNITYSTDTLDLLSVSSGNNFYLASPGSPGKGNGTAFFSGGIPTPGYNGTGGVLGIMTFRAKAQGSASVSVTGGKVLLNDGQGTNVYSGGSGAKFTISPPPPTPVGSVEVKSSTHPDQNSWYSNKHIELTWNKPSGTTGFSYWFNQNPDTTPDDSVESTDALTKNYDQDNGVWYFHIKALGAVNSQPTHYKLQIDNQAPNPFDIKLVGEANANSVSDTPTISFEATDELSGILG